MSIQIREIFKNYHVLNKDAALTKCLPRVKQRPIFISFFVCVVKSMLQSWKINKDIKITLHEILTS